MWSTIINTKFSDNGIAMLRIWLGIIMMKHSYPVIAENGFSEFGDWIGSLGVPLPYFMAYIAKGGEFLGGALLAAGFLTRVGAFLIFVNMVVAVTVASDSAIFTKAELPFGYLLIALAIFLHGPDRWSIDNRLKQQTTTT
ncbi:MAG: DoxX family protein [Fulvivirga sp.]